MVTEENVLSKAYSLNSELNALAIFQNIRPLVRRGGVSHYGVLRPTHSWTKMLRLL